MHPLWLAIRLPQLPLEVLSPPPAEEPRGSGPRGSGPWPRLFPRNPRAEREALKALCAAATTALRQRSAISVC